MLFPLRVTLRWKSNGTIRWSATKWPESVLYRRIPSPSPMHWQLVAPVAFGMSLTRVTFQHRLPTESILIWRNLVLALLSHQLVIWRPIENNIISLLLSFLPPPFPNICYHYLFCFSCVFCCCWKLYYFDLFSEWKGRRRRWRSKRRGKKTRKNDKQESLKVRVYVVEENMESVWFDLHWSALKVCRWCWRGIMSVLSLSLFSLFLSFLGRKLIPQFSLSNPLSNGSDYKLVSSASGEHSWEGPFLPFPELINEKRVLRMLCIHFICAVEWHPSNIPSVIWSRCWRVQYWYQRT